MNEDRLTGLDASFLHMERAGAHMHVASTILFDGSPPTHEEFRDHIESRLHLVPRFRQKLRTVPFDQGRPVWVDDPFLNLDYHVRRTALPAPGSEEQLRNLAARIFSQQLDRTKPLWELWLVEGLAEDRFAVVGKSHHALVDGISGVDITTVLFDLEEEPDNPPVRPPKWAPRPEPTDLDLLAAAWRERATSPREFVRGVRAALRGPRQVLRGLADTGKFLEGATGFGRWGSSRCGTKHATWTEVRVT
jgi:WS/DGAT/MGAT family acyltransferase